MDRSFLWKLCASCSILGCAAGVIKTKSMIGRIGDSPAQSLAEPRALQGGPFCRCEGQGKWAGAWFRRLSTPEMRLHKSASAAPTAPGHWSGALFETGIYVGRGGRDDDAS